MRSARLTVYIFSCRFDVCDSYSYAEIQITTFLTLRNLQNGDTVLDIMLCGFLLDVHALKVLFYFWPEANSDKNNYKLLRNMLQKWVMTKIEVKLKNEKNIHFKIFIHISPRNLASKSDWISVNFLVGNPITSGMFPSRI